MNATTSDLQGLTGSGREPGTARIAPPPYRWKTRLLLPGLILAAVVALLLITSAHTLLPATAVRVVPVVVKTVEGAAGTVTVQAPGWLEPDPHPYYVAALADGVVNDMKVLEGDRVEADQVVATMVDDDARLTLARADAELLARRSDLLAAEAELSAATLHREHLIERTRAVALSEAAVAEAEAQLKQLRADIAVEEARLMEIADEYDRKSQLTESQAVSAAAVARLLLRRDAQQATIEAAEAKQGVLQARLDQAAAELAAATTNRRLLIEEERAVALAEAAVGTARASIGLAEAIRAEAALRLKRMEIRTPVAGVVMQRLASPGSKLTREGPEHSAHVVHIYDPKHLQVRVDVPLADAAHVSVGQGVEVTVEVLPDHTFAGIVTRIVHQADIQKNTVEVKVAVDVPTVDLKPEMLARVRFLAMTGQAGGAIRQRLFAPAALVQQAAGGDPAILVVTDLVGQRGRAAWRTVTPGATRIDQSNGGAWVEIEAGLQVGELLIADPPADLEPGDRVRLLEEQAPSAVSSPPVSRWRPAPARGFVGLHRRISGYVCFALRATHWCRRASAKLSNWKQH